MNELITYLLLNTINRIGFSDEGVTGYHFASKYPTKLKKLIAVGANYQVAGMKEPTIN